jgi:hypothetical protein
MNVMREEARETPVRGEYDVIVRARRAADRHLPEGAGRPRAVACQPGPMLIIA